MDGLKLSKGIKFGKWTVKNDSPIFDDSGKTLWQCECECGNTSNVSTSNLMNGLSTQCIDCAKKEVGIRKRKNAGEISGDLWSQIITRARKKGYKIDITITDAWLLFLEQNSRCAYTGIKLQFYGYSHNKKLRTAELIVKNPALGFTIDNLAWVHKDIAKMKGNDSEPTFLATIENIHNHLYGKNK